MIGSTWCKWDLHIHSPLTHQNNQYKEASIEDFSNKVIEQDLSLIGVTNYFYFSENELELIRDSFSAIKKDIVVLGNIEFRISQPNKDGEWINVHCIFSDKIKTSKVNSVLSKLPLNVTNNDHKTIYCCQESLQENNIKTKSITVDFNKLIKHLKNNFLFGKDFFIAGCPNGYGGYRPNQNGRSKLIADEIEKKCQIILGRSKDRDFFLSENRNGKASIAKPVFCCSDAHEMDAITKKSKENNENNYTWVKAKPTFEGLRQAILEPKDRVKQTDSFIENNYIKPYFSSIKISGTIFSGEKIRFKEQNIPLNPNLVTIIGGRGTGKSLFLDAMYSTFNNDYKEYHRKVDVDNLTVLLDKGEGEEFPFYNSNDDTYSYLHVPQGSIKNFTNKPDDLSKEIKKMLKIKDDSFNKNKIERIYNYIEIDRRFVSFKEEKDIRGY